MTESYEYDVWIWQKEKNMIGKELDMKRLVDRHYDRKLILYDRNTIWYKTNVDRHLIDRYKLGRLG